jgi:hypothetical protein
MNALLIMMSLKLRNQEDRMATPGVSLGKREAMQAEKNEPSAVLRSNLA